MDIKIFPIFRPKKVRTLSEQWAKASLVEKAQILSTFATLATLIVIAIQIADNHRLIKATERQTLIASQQNGAGLSPKVEPISVTQVRGGGNTLNEPFDVAISYKNIGSSRAEDITTTAYLSIGNVTFTDSKLNDLLVQGEGDYFVVQLRGYVWNPQTKARAIVRTRYFGSADDYAAAPKTSCDEFAYKPGNERFEHIGACK
jgi:hypothetical protein